MKMWTSCLFVLSILHLQTAHAADCSHWRFLCEEPFIFIDDAAPMKSIRMPLDSSTCNSPGEAADCESRVTTKPGQKMVVRVGIGFEIGPDVSPCPAARHVMFTSEDEKVLKSDRKCGKEYPQTVLFQSVNEEMVINYVSDTPEDGAAIEVEAFGCPLEDFVAPNPETKLEPKDFDFTYDVEEYEGLLTCAEGYLMPGNISSKTTVCQSSGIVHPVSWTWATPTEETTCNRVMCEQITPPANGQYELSNMLYHKSTATFSCGEGYILEGDAIQTCIVQSGIGSYWQGITPTCKTIVCPSPPVHPDWDRMSLDSVRWLLGDSVSYTCSHDDSIVTITCENNGGSSDGAWTELPTCRKQPPLAPPSPTERITKLSNAKEVKEKSDKGAIIGGVIAGFIFAIIVIILACIFIRKSKAKRKDAKNNNNNNTELRELKEPLNGTAKPEKPKRLPADGDVEKQLPEYAAVVTHHRNRGNDRIRNGVNGTSNSHKSSGSASSAELMSADTGDMLESVLNGGNSYGSYGKRSMVSGQCAVHGDRKSSGSSERRSAASMDRKSAEDRRSGVSGDRRSGTSGDRKSSTSTDRRSAASEHRKSNGSFDRRSRKGSAPSTPRCDTELNESQINGVVAPNKQNTTVPRERVDFF